MMQAVNCDLLYADDTGLIFQHKDINIANRTTAKWKFFKHWRLVCG